MSSEFVIPSIFSIPYLIFFGIILFLIFAGLCIYVFYFHYYVQIKPDEIAVIKRNDRLKVVSQGFVFLIPIIDEVYFLPKTPLEFTVITEDLRNIEGFKFKVTAKLRAGLDDSPAALMKSSLYFKSVLDISSVINELFKTVISIEFMNPGSNMKNLCENLMELEERMESDLREELFLRGLLFLSVKIVSIEDSEGIMAKFKSH